MGDTIRGIFAAACPLREHLVRIQALAFRSAASVTARPPSVQFYDELSGHACYIFGPARYGIVVAGYAVAKRAAEAVVRAGA
jgi:hypothetical protein